MILRTKTTKSKLNVKIGDEIELIISNINNNELVKTLVKVVDIPKEDEVCSSCGCLLHGKGIIYIRQLYCDYCLRREQERRSQAQTGHPRYKNASLKINIKKT